MTTTHISIGGFLDGHDEERLRVALAAVRARVDERLKAAGYQTGGATGGLDEDGVGEYARTVTGEEARDYLDKLALSGVVMPSPGMAKALARRVYDEMFGFGCLQSLLDDPDVEEIDINGCDQVWVNYADGAKQPGPPVADSDEQLVELVRRWATHQTENPRDFSVAKPRLHLALRDGSRLAAMMAVTPRPHVSIRPLRLLDVDLDGLVERGSLDAGLAGFLAAAVRARKDIVVTGGMAAGKTTFVRALASAIDPLERVVTIENERELYLHRQADRHADVVPFQAREPNSEGVGGISVHQLIADALRMHARRVIVGEVRGDELVAMLHAMNTGGEGSLCTLHANSAGEVWSRMFVLATSGGLSIPRDALFELAGMAVDFVVHLAHERRRVGDHKWINRRYVAEVYEVLPPGDSVEPAVNRVYVPGPDGRATPHTTPQSLEELVAAGFDPAHLSRGREWERGD